MSFYWIIASNIEYFNVSQEKYFREELTFLREQGRQFSEINPQLSKFLNGRITDPDVERLLEGFAFLTARVQQKVDDQFPEITHSLINMLWPNYLRPIPSMAIIRFSPNSGQVDKKLLVKKGTRLESVKIQNTTCIFNTCRDVEMYPFIVDSVETQRTQESSEITVNFVTLKNDPFLQWLKQKKEKTNDNLHDSIH